MLAITIVLDITMAITMVTFLQVLEIISLPHLLTGCVPVNGTAAVEDGMKDGMVVQAQISDVDRTLLHHFL